MSNPFEPLQDQLDKQGRDIAAIKAMLVSPAKNEVLQEQDKTLPFKQACAYVDLSESYMRQLCHRKEIPYYNPRGRRIYFLRSELDTWLLQNRQGDAETIALNHKV